MSLPSRLINGAHPLQADPHGDQHGDGGEGDDYGQGYRAGQQIVVAIAQVADDAARNEGSRQKQAQGDRRLNVEFTLAGHDDPPRLTSLFYTVALRRQARLSEPPTPPERSAVPGG
ncbi:hypothetical protein D3C85_1494340 [compost metagenome]